LIVLPGIAADPAGGRRVVAAAFDAAGYALASLGSTFFLIGFFASPRPFLNRLARPFARQSFGIYWLHMVVLMPTLYCLLGIPLPAALKFAVGCLAPGSCAHG
jgi:hypothetical protein